MATAANAEVTVRPWLRDDRLFVDAFHFDAVLEELDAPLPAHGALNSRRQTQGRPLVKSHPAWHKVTNADIRFARSSDGHGMNADASDGGLTRGREQTSACFMPIADEHQVPTGACGKQRFAKLHGTLEMRL